MRSLYLAVTTCVIGLSGEASLAQDRDALVVPTESGPVRGGHNGAVEAFLGIPYAAPPVGGKRWQPPQPAESWKDVREAKAFGAYCAAAKSTNGPRSEAEDCLFINVWRPSDVSADARLPVYVFIHGGGFINGSSNQADMTEIVEKTGVIGVSFNYRLGVQSGFLPILTSPRSPRDFGLMDQQAALHWVHENILLRSEAIRRGSRSAVSPLAAIRSASARIWPRHGSAWPLCSGYEAKRYVFQHSSGSSTKERRRDRRRGRVQGAGRG